MQPATKKLFDTILLCAVVLLFIFLVYSVWASLHTRQNTGMLEITTSNKQAIISITQNDTSATIVGTGSAKVRLKPGSYQVVAAASSMKANKIVNVVLHKATEVTLTLKPPAVLPSPDTINFSGFDALAQVGVTPAQITNLQQSFFNYKPSAKNITIDPGSVNRAPYDPTSNNPVLQYDFTGTIDGQAYRATITYVDLSHMQLALYNPQTGVQLN